MLSSCQKSEDGVIAYAENYFYPPADADPNEMVKNFLAYIPDARTAALRNDFPDTEINEGKWLMEASGNYLDNTNLLSHGVESIEKFDVHVQNVVTDGYAKLSGSDLTAKFADLQNSLGALESGDKIASAMDVKLKEIDNSVSKFEATVIYTKPLPAAPDGVQALHTFEQAEPFLNLYLQWMRDAAIQQQIDDCTMSIWFPDVSVLTLGKPTASSVDHVKLYYPNNELPNTCSESTAFGNGIRCMVTVLDKYAPYYYGDVYPGVNSLGIASLTWREAHVAFEVANDAIADAQAAQSAEWQQDFEYLPAGVKANYAEVPMNFDFNYFDDHPNPNELGEYSEFYEAALGGCDTGGDGTEECMLHYFFVEFVVVAETITMCHY